MDENGTLQIAPELPRAIEELELDGPRSSKELWLLARTYSRLRHRTSPRKHPLERGRFTDLKLYCIRLALARDRATFLVFVDPGTPHLRLTYHRLERTLLHVPVETDLGLLIDAARSAPPHSSNRDQVFHLEPRSGSPRIKGTLGPADAAARRHSELGFIE